MSPINPTAAQPQPRLSLRQHPRAPERQQRGIGIGLCPWPLITVASAGGAPGMWWSTTTVGTPGFGSASRTPKSVMTTPPARSSANSVRIASDHGLSPRPTMRVRTAHPASPKARANKAVADKPSASLWPRIQTGLVRSNSWMALAKTEAVSVARQCETSSNHKAPGACGFVPGLTVSGQTSLSSVPESPRTQEPSHDPRPQELRDSDQHKGHHNSSGQERYQRPLTFNANLSAGWHGASSTRSCPMNPC